MRTAPDVTPAVEAAANATLAAAATLRAGPSIAAAPKPLRLSRPLVQAPAVRAAAVHAKTPAKTVEDRFI
jgi:hypothetical protein